MIFLKKLKKRNLIFDFISTHTHMKASGMRACYILEQEKRVFYKNNFHARTHKSVDGPKTFTLKNYFSFL